MDKFEFIVRSEMENVADRELYKMFGNKISDYDFTLNRIVDLAIEHIMFYNDFIADVDDWEYESGIEWCVELAIENILESEK